MTIESAVEIVKDEFQKVTGAGPDLVGFLESLCIPFIGLVREGFSVQTKVFSVGSETRLKLFLDFPDLIVSFVSPAVESETPLPLRQELLRPLGKVVMDCPTFETSTGHFLFRTDSVISLEELSERTLRRIVGRTAARHREAAAAVFSRILSAHEADLGLRCQLQMKILSATEGFDHPKEILASLDTLFERKKNLFRRREDLLRALEIARQSLLSVSQNWKEVSDQFRQARASQGLVISAKTPLFLLFSSAGLH